MTFHTKIRNGQTSHLDGSNSDAAPPSEFSGGAIAAPDRRLARFDHGPPWHEAELQAVVEYGEAPGVATLAEADGILAAWFERHQCEAALVWPDHLVYGVARTCDDIDELVRCARTRLGMAPSLPMPALRKTV